MNVVDSSGWLEYFNDRDNAGFFVTAIEAVDELIIPSISLFEVFKRILIERNRDDALEAIALMKAGDVVDLDDNLALVAAELSFELKLPMVDSIILATARAYTATLWTQEAHFKDIDGVRYIEKKT